ncbi:MAG: hypothetical protein SGILL_004560 [Bacillariaceae sp.]
MNWLPWGRKKNRFDFNAFLVSKAKQQKQEEAYQKQQKELQELELEAANDAANNIDKSNSQGGSQSSIALIRKRASARAHSLSTALPFSLNQPKSFSLVLTDDDLKGLELQRKLDTLRRQGEDAKRMQNEERDILKQVLGESKKSLTRKLRDGNDWSDYLEIAQQEIAAMEAEQRHQENKNGVDNEDEEDEGSASGSMSSIQGRQEADLMKALHKVELQERTRKRLQEFTNEEILKMYAMESTIKEDFTEQEVKILSQLAKIDAIVGEHRHYHEARVEIYGRMIERYEKAAEMHVERIYKALREQSEDEDDHIVSASKGNDDDGNLKVRFSLPKTPSAPQSYSTRILAVQEQEKEESQRAQRSLPLAEEPSQGQLDVLEEKEDKNSDDERASVVSVKSDDGLEQDGVDKRHSSSSGSPSVTQTKRTARSSGQPLARSTGASRDARDSVARNGTSTSATSRADSMAAARARAAERAANSSTKTALTSGTASRVASRRVQPSTATRPIKSLSHVPPRRVGSGTARK